LFFSRFPQGDFQFLARDKKHIAAGRYVHRFPRFRIVSPAFPAFPDFQRSEAPQLYGFPRGKSGGQGINEPGSQRSCLVHFQAPGL
jgi:hypothetical protein